jgi:glutathione S-transferase
VASLIPYAAPRQKDEPTAKATLVISSKNYSSWSLGDWLMTQMSGLPFEEQTVPIDDPTNRAELLLLSPSVPVPRLIHDGVTVRDTLAIGEYLNETRPEAGLLPADKAARAHCRAICSEMYAGLSNLRSALPMNLKVHRPGFKIWSGAQADIERITTIWRECLAPGGGPYLFGHLSMADAMYAPVVTRFLTYDVPLDPVGAAYGQRIMALPDMLEWVEAARAEPDALEDLEVEF